MKLYDEQLFVIQQAIEKIHYFYTINNCPKHIYFFLREKLFNILAIYDQDFLNKAIHDIIMFKIEVQTKNKNGMKLLNMIIDCLLPICSK